MRSNSSTRKYFDYAADFPKYFPSLTRMSVDFQGHLRVYQGIDMVDKGHDRLVMDSSGKILENPIPAKNLGSILAHDTKWIYLSVRKDDDELTVRKVRRDDWP